MKNAKRFIPLFWGYMSCICILMAQPHTFNAIDIHKNNAAVHIKSIIIQPKATIVKLEVHGGATGTKLQIARPNHPDAPYLKTATATYPLKSSRNIAFAPLETLIKPKRSKIIELHFDPIPLCMGTFDIIDTNHTHQSGQGLSFYNVRLARQNSQKLARFRSKQAFKTHFDKKKKAQSHEGIWEVQYYTQTVSQNNTVVSDIKSDTVAILYERGVYEVFYFNGSFYGSEFHKTGSGLNFILFQENGQITCAPVTMDNANTFHIDLELRTQSSNNTASNHIFYEWTRLGTKTTASNLHKKPLHEPTITQANMLIHDDNFPRILETEKGLEVSTKNDWWQVRRPELLSIFEAQVYGAVPQQAISVRHRVLNEDHNALNGLAIRKEIELSFTNNRQTVKATVLLYVPKNVSEPVPVFLGYNFYGNHTIFPEPAISISPSWVNNKLPFGITNHQATDLSRGVSANRWPLLNLLNRGYGLATMYYGDIDPDYDDGFQNGIQPLFYTEGQQHPDKHEWGAISAWAYGLSRVLDYLETDDHVDLNRVIVMGHSRLGKAALWAGAQDERFAGVVSNSTGCGGAALSRRKVGESVKAINEQFPHWFCENFKQYNDHEDNLPIDQHQLIALISPRPVYIASASEDTWADPLGEFLTGKAATVAFELLGREGLVAEIDTPKINQSYHNGYIGYHQRAGKPDLTYYDWEQFMDFMDIRLDYTVAQEKTISPQQPLPKPYLGEENTEKGIGFAQTVQVGETIYVTALSGIGRDVKTQLKNAYVQLQAILESHGISPQQVVKETIFTTDMDAFLKARAIRKQFYKDSTVATSLVGVERLADRGTLIEIEVIISLEK